MNNDRVTMSEQVRIISDSDGAVLMDVRAGTYYSANRVASEILTAINEGASASSIAAQLSAKYSVSQAQATADVEAFIEGLVERQFVVNK
jgi:hypothetical protein